MCSEYFGLQEAYSHKLNCNFKNRSRKSRARLCTKPILKVQNSFMRGVPRMLSYSKEDHKTIEEGAKERKKVRR